MWERENRYRIFFLIFCCISNMLVRWVASSLRPPLEYISKIGACKLSSPNIFVASIQLSLPHVSSLTTQKYESSPTFHLVSMWGTSASIDSAHAYKNFWDLQFSLVIFNYNKSLDLAVQRLHFYSFIFSIFYELFNYVTEVLHIPRSFRTGATTSDAV